MPREDSYSKRARQKVRSLDRAQPDQSANRSTLDRPVSHWPAGRSTRGETVPESIRARCGNARAPRDGVAYLDADAIDPPCRATAIDDDGHNGVRIGPQPTEQSECLRIAASRRRRFGNPRCLGGARRNSSIKMSLRVLIQEGGLKAWRGRLCFLLLVTLFASAGSGSYADNMHSLSSGHSDFRGLVMCGYQGWFRAEGDGSGEGWKHYGYGPHLGPDHVTVDLWPDISEYSKTYLTPFTLKSGEPARAYSSIDASTIDVHFRWMYEYGIDGVFLQRFYGVTRNPQAGAASRAALAHAIRAAQKHGRAIAIMYDLSGLRPGEDDCDAIIDDWKRLVDELQIASRGDTQPYLYHRNKPLVAIWGLGFPDRPYDIRQIGVDRLMSFLKDDPQYGGCSIMLVYCINQT